MVVRTYITDVSEKKGQKRGSNNQIICKQNWHIATSHTHTPISFHSVTTINSGYKDSTGTVLFFFF